MRKTIAALHHAFCGAFFLFSLSPTSQAQEKPLIAGWVQAAPAVQADENGEPTGFFSDLARLLAQEAGLELQFKEYPDATSFSAAYENDETTFYAGLPKVLAAVLQMDQSEELSPIRVSLFARLDRLDEHDLSFSTPQTVGFAKSMQHWTDGVLPDGLEPVIF